MKTIVFGATSSIGKLLVKQLLNDGHRVTAFARNPNKLEINHPSLSLVAGDVMDQEKVKDAIADHNAVVVTLGSGMSRTSKVRSIGTKNIIQAMTETGVRRLICQTTLGAHESRSNLNFYWKRIMFGLLLKPVLKDHEKQEDLVRQSGLDWTIIRPSSFTDGPATGQFHTNFSPKKRNLKLTISRADISNFIRQQLMDSTFVHKAVGISN